MLGFAMRPIWGPGVPGIALYGCARSGKFGLSWDMYFSEIAKPTRPHTQINPTLFLMFECMVVGFAISYVEKHVYSVF